jgi:hypothetical protein
LPYFVIRKLLHIRAYKLKSLGMKPIEMSSKGQLALLVIAGMSKDLYYKE